jgi:hypothetical protein
MLTTWFMGSRSNLHFYYAENFPRRIFLMVMKLETFWGFSFKFGVNFMSLLQTF